ncbi:MAG: hypothetical protein ACR2PH_07955 [Desulfobulbia bacterium]
MSLMKFGLIALIPIVIAIYTSSWFWTISFVILGILAIYVCMRIIEKQSPSATTPIVKWNKSGWVNTPI